MILKWSSLFKKPMQEDHEGKFLKKIELLCHLQHLQDKGNLISIKPTFVKSDKKRVNLTEFLTEMLNGNA